MKGHNSNAFYGGLSAEHLKQFIDRLERLEEEKRNIAQDIKEVFAEAKGTGFDVKTMRKIIKIRKIEANEREEQEFLLDTYMRALGMTPTEDDEEVEIPQTRSKELNIRLVDNFDVYREALAKDAELLKGDDADFISVIETLYGRYGKNTLITEAQLSWLQDIADRE